jgi:hypothetical protein
LFVNIGCFQLRLDEYIYQICNLHVKIWLIFSLYFEFMRLGLGFCCIKFTVFNHWLLKYVFCFIVNQFLGRVLELILWLLNNNNGFCRLGRIIHQRKRIEIGLEHFWIVAQVIVMIITIFDLMRRILSVLIVQLDCVGTVRMLILVIEGFRYIDIHIRMFFVIATYKSILIAQIFRFVTRYSILLNDWLINFLSDLNQFNLLNCFCFVLDLICVSLMYDKL